MSSCGRVKLIFQTADSRDEAIIFFFVERRDRLLGRPFEMFEIRQTHERGVVRLGRLRPCCLIGLRDGRNRGVFRLVRVPVSDAIARESYNDNGNGACSNSLVDRKSRTSEKAKTGRWQHTF